MPTTTAAADAPPVTIPCCAFIGLPSRPFSTRSAPNRRPPLFRMEGATQPQKCNVRLFVLIRARVASPAPFSDLFIIK